MPNLPPGSRPHVHLNTLEEMRLSYEQNKAAIPSLAAYTAGEKEAMMDDVGRFIAALEWAIERCKLQ